MFITYSDKIISSDVASGSTVCACDQARMLNPVTAASAMNDDSVAHTADSIGIMIACTSTQAYTLLTGVARKSSRPEADAPTSAIRPFSCAGETRSARMSEIEIYGKL